MLTGSKAESKDVGAATQQPAVSAAAVAAAAAAAVPTPVAESDVTVQVQPIGERLKPDVAAPADTTDMENPSDEMKSYPEPIGVSARFRDAATGMSRSFNAGRGSALNFARRRPCTTCCCSFSILATLVLVPLLWPQDPTWHIVDLEMDPDALQGMIAAVTGQANETRPLYITSKVEVKNTNYIGAKTENGKYTVEMKNGGYQIASGTSRNSYVPPRGSAIVTNDVIAEFPLEVGPIIVTDALQNGGIVALIARANADAKVLFLRIHATVVCNLNVNVFYSTDAGRIIESKTCEYTYF